MIKRLFLSLAILAGLFSPAYAAGTIPWSLSQQLDALGKPLTGCKLYIYAAGTTTPQSAYQDTALTNAWPNPLTCDSAGRLPQFFLADGLVKIRLTDKNGVTQAYAGQGSIDNILVIGPSSGGGGGGGSIDPTTIMATGDVKARYGTGVLSGFVRLNARTIGSATSGATERANADAQALFEYLWGADANLVVSTGRGASANADWVANKTIALPDGRSRSLAALGDMGNSDNALFSGVTFTSGNSTTLGSRVGAARRSLLLSNLPPITPSGSVATTTTTTVGVSVIGGFSAGVAQFLNPVGQGNQGNSPTASTSVSTSTFTGSVGGGSSDLFDTVSPYLLVTLYMKL